MSPTPSPLEALAPVIEGVVAPKAEEIDRDGTYPRAALDALGKAGLLGPQTHRAAAEIVEELARNCASTAMVVLMHYAGAAVIEAHGPKDVKEQIAAGQYVATLAFSEKGSRSQFWAPLSSARAGDDSTVTLDAEKSWVTSAGQADGYVWSSRPLAADGPSTIWLVPNDAPGLSVGAPFDGLGLRGNYSSPMAAVSTKVPIEAMLGPDAGGFDIMLGTVLPLFQTMTAAFCVGTMDAATAKTGKHAATTRLEHLDQSLADNPVVRSNVARMRVKTDLTRALLADTLDALESGREDAVLRVLEVKAAAGEAATEVTDLAMRVCGGSAFRRDFGVDRHFRDSRAATVMAPTTDALYDFIGRVACGMELFG
ncbi:MAG TPA: acyl-CoA dehydrogenase family protein [Acidimicrobiales bacterium]|nr:acyl-CoA dehydrogenase family protein [Acidimicrobiales bacterium]